MKKQFDFRKMSFYQIWTRSFSDCTATGAVAPTVTWPATFHPRTDAATDFACEAGKRNVYFISEFAPGEFAVGGWQETAGGNAS